MVGELFESEFFVCWGHGPHDVLPGVVVGDEHREALLPVIEVFLEAGLDAHLESRAERNVELLFDYFWILKKII